MAAAALELALDDVLAAVLDDVLGAAAAVLVLLLLLLPHPATTMAASRQRKMNRVRTSCTLAPSTFGVSSAEDSVRGGILPRAVIAGAD
jgi:hypothetical protein